MLLTESYLFSFAFLFICANVNQHLLSCCHVAIDYNPSSSSRDLLILVASLLAAEPRTKVILCGIRCEF